MIIWVKEEKKVEDPWSEYEWERDEVACPACGGACSKEFPCFWCEGRGYFDVVVFYDEEGEVVAYEGEESAFLSPWEKLLLMKEMYQFYAVD